ncbi:MAG TPA: Os1348 family NHLP clan protein [Candidatus Aquilonibacter sp.]
MSHDAVADLVERYLNDSAFRAAFADDPEAALAAGGFELDSDELAALHSTVCSHDDQPLKAAGNQVLVRLVKIRDSREANPLFFAAGSLLAAGNRIA